MQAGHGDSRNGGNVEHGVRPHPAMDLRGNPFRSQDAVCKAKIYDPIQSCAAPQGGSRDRGGRMSISLMTAAFKTRMHSTHKFVLVALCDNANDQGECYPSIAMLCEKTSLSDRAVQKSIAYLVEHGYVRRDMRSGRSNYFYIAQAASWQPVTPAARAPRTMRTPNGIRTSPEPDAPPPANAVHPTPERGSPITVIEPPMEPSGKHQGDALQVGLPEWLPQQAWADWIAYRQAGKAKFTARAAQLALIELGKLRDAGHDPQAVIEQSIYRGWSGFFPLKAQRGGGASHTAASAFERGQEAAERARRMIFGDQHEGTT